MTINKKIVNNIEQRGFTVRAGNNRTDIASFENKPISKKIFDLLSKKPFYRVVFQMIYDEIPSTIDEILNELDKDNLKAVFSKSPLINLNCPHCGFLMGFYNPYIQGKPRRRRKCTYCHIESRLNECDEEEDWRLPYNQVYNIMEKYVEIQLIDLKYYGYCKDHGAQDIEVLNKGDINSLSNTQLLDYIYQYYCRKCDKLNEVDVSFIKTSTSEFFNGGVWLEWYIKKLLSANNNLIIENSLRVFDSENVNYEIDVAVLYNKKLYCIECKAIKPTKKIGLNDMGYIEKWKKFSDYVIMSTTGKIKDRDRKLLSRESIKTYELMDVENITNVFT